MMYKLFIGIVGAFSIFCLGITQASASTVDGINLDRVKDTAENVSLDSFILLAQEYSIPITVIIVFVSAFSFLLGMFFKPLKIVGGSIFGVGILFYAMVNFAPEIVGIIKGVLTSLMNRVSGGN